MSYLNQVKTLVQIALLGAALFLSPSASAKEKSKFEIDATIGGRFGGGLDVVLEHSTEGDIKGRVSVDSSPSYGGIVGYRVQSNGFVFLSYSRQDSTFRFRPTEFDRETVEGDGSIEYIQLGGNLEATSGAFTPYFGFSIGTGHFASHDGGGDAWRFSAVLDGGVKLQVLPFLHLRLLGRMPFTFQGGELYCYSGYGCAVAVSGTPFVQGELQAGLGLNF